MATAADPHPASTRTTSAAGAAPLPWDCPGCGSRELHPSRAAGRREAVLRAVTPLVLYRCHACQRRGWHLPKWSALARPIRAASARRSRGAEGAAAAPAARPAAAAGAIARAAARLSPRPALAAAAQWARLHRRPIAAAAIVACAVATLGGGAWWVVARHGRALQLAAGGAVSSGRGLLSAVGDRVLPREPEPAAPPAVKEAPPRADRAAKHRRSRRARVAAAIPPQPVAPASTRSASAPVAWHGARWGMSVDEVVRAVPGAEVERRAGRDARAAASTEIAGHRYAVDLRFDRRGRLSAVDLTPAAREGDPAAAYDELAAWLTAENGPAAVSGQDVSEAGSWARASSWATAASRIELRAWDTSRPEARVLAFDLRSGAIQPAARGVVLTLSPAQPAEPALRRAASAR